MNKYNLKNGDIILFNGKGLVSNIIKIGTFSKYSHVGIVVNGLIFESTTMANCREVRKGMHFDGVQMFDANERIDSYKGKVYLKSFDGERKVSERINKFVDENYWKPYNESMWEVIKSGVSWLPSCKETPDSLFCSELVSYMLREYNIYYDKGMKHNDYSPKDISKVLGYYKIKKIK